MPNASKGAAYAPAPIPNDVAALPAFLGAELRAVARAVQLLAAGHIDPSYAAPARPREGDIRLADGTSWNPGAGAGVYAYYGGAWNKLG
jgi:hypothetical protein